MLIHRFTTEVGLVGIAQSQREAALTIVDRATNATTQTRRRFLFTSKPTHHPNLATFFTLVSTRNTVQPRFSNFVVTDG